MRRLNLAPGAGRALQALENGVAGLAAGGAEPKHLVQMTGDVGGKLEIKLTTLMPD